MSNEIRVIAEKVAYDLQGTCQSLEVVLERHECEDLRDNRQFCDALDSLVFECEQCSWWYEQSEMADNADWVCGGCA